MTLSNELKEELTKYLVQKFNESPEFTDDSTEISEYVVLLISNGRNAEETYEEVQSLVSFGGLKDVILSTYSALESYQNNQNQQQQAQIQTTNVQPWKEINGDVQINTEDTSNVRIPSKPAALINRIGVKNGSGINKRLSNGPKNFALKNADAFQKALNLSNANGSDTFVNARGQLKKKGRCHKFPHCPHKDCLYAHPTKPCFQYPNCPNAPGTCNFLHPGEDDALIAELEKTRQEYHQKKSNGPSKFAQNNTGIALCKFGTVCSNQQCPFGHPTPANEDAKVIQLEWCPANLKCEDSSCGKAHSSLSKVKEVKPIQAAAPEKSLDPCKFGSRCTNRYCKFRHATSPVLCREGENCQRIDCFFSHPINEDCRFGESCKNTNCLFKHPNGKAPAAGIIPAKSLTWTKTDERQFAVPDSEVLEKAPLQED